MRLFLLVLMSFCLSVSALEMPTFFSDDAVLQRDMRVPVWGKAPAGQKVTVSFAGQTKTAVAGADGTWRVELEPMTACKEGRELTISGDTTIVCKNVLVGDVWLCAGQSNMAYGMWGINGAKQLLDECENPSIRILNIPYLWARVPVDDFREMSPEYLVRFKKILADSKDSKICEFFAKNNLAQHFPEDCSALTPAITKKAIELARNSSDLQTVRQFTELKETVVDESFDYGERPIRHALLNVLAVSQDPEIAKIYQAKKADIEKRKEKFRAIDEKTLLTLRDLLKKTQDKATLDAYAKAKDEALTATLAVAPSNPKWVKCNRPNVGGTSAVGYLMSKHLQAELGIPIGMVRVAWGGAPVEALTSLEAIQAVPELKQLAAQDEKSLGELREKGPDGGWKMSTMQVYQKYKYFQFIHNVLFYAMVQPLSPMAVKGMVWYQGEGNCGNGKGYGDKLKALAIAWRGCFENPTMPIYIVLLPPYQYSKQDSTRLPRFLEEQRRFADTDPYSGYIVTTDCGNPDDIHPLEKRPLSRRLAQLVLYKSYGIGDTSALAPTFMSAEVKGNQVIVQFNNPNGLKTRDNLPPSHVELAGKDGVFHAADHTAIVNDTLVASSKDVPAPTQIRFGWDNIANPNLVNRSEHPVMPFSTAVPTRPRHTLGK